MRWSPGDESQDIEDRRDESGGGGGFQFGGKPYNGSVLVIRLGSDHLMAKS